MQIYYISIIVYNPAHNHNCVFATCLSFSSKAEDRDAASKCQQHDFLYGLLFYNLPSSAEAAATGQNPQLSNQMAIANLLLKLGLGNIDRMSFNASFAASRKGVFVDPEWRRNAYDFCELPGVRTVIVWPPSACFMCDYLLPMVPVHLPD